MKKMGTERDKHEDNCKMSNYAQKSSLLVTVISWGLALLSQYAHSASNIGQVTVKVVIMTPPPCTINNNQPIEVDFGEVMVTRVDGTNYRKLIDYNLNCPTEQLAKNALRLQIQGTSINLGGAISVLGVPNVPDFGIQLQHDATAFEPNTWLNFSYPDVPDLYAVPVMKSGSVLTTGAFSTSSTMKVEYQ